MIRPLLSLVLLLCVNMTALAGQADNPFPKVKLETNYGNMVIELNRLRAPKTVENFLRYVESGRYNNVLFHRVIDNFMIQTGGIKADRGQVQTDQPLFNEAGNGLKNGLGTVAMARQNDPHSATSQFFINLNDNEWLDPSNRGWGYAVFGAVIEGLEVAEKIGKLPTQVDPQIGWPDWPVEPVVLKSATLMAEE